MPTNSATGRRRFLAKSAEISLGLAVLVALANLSGGQEAPGANECVRLAFCDADENALRQRLADMEKLGLPKPQTYTDVRKLLKDKSIHALCS